ncbi:MAG TPA: hypothetical protein VK921_17925 [Anditalea sp.]|nr:hypothetical protein [Anditalea sp.]
MKKLIYLFILAIGFTSCSVESIDSTENLLVVDAKAPKAQELPEYLDYPSTACAGDIVEFIFYFNDKPGNLPLKLQLEVNGDWINIFNENFGGSGPESFLTTFEMGVYNLRYQIGGGGHTDFTLEVGNCNSVCAKGKGYWTNHGPVNPGNQENAYPNGGIKIGNTYYQLSALQSILQEKGNSGSVLKMKQHLITVLLNIANGVDGSSMDDIISAANAIIVANGDGYSPQDINNAKDALEAFNKANACEDFEEQEEE